MAAYYAQPTPSYHATPAHSIRQRGYRICDQCGAAENPSVSRFRLCGGCMTTQYCSHGCQKVHWPSHKAICQHTADQVAAVKQPSAAAAYGGENVAKSLRKFTSAHAALLGWAGFQALQLKRIPANVRQNALLVELTPTAHAESHRRFSISAAHVVPRTYILDPLVTADIARREARCRRAGGIGTAVVIIQCGSVSQVMPVEVDAPSKITWDETKDWARVLWEVVESGRTDWVPGGRGVYYG
ncbi:hypothetical protein C8R46DRAFT_1350258 [Mycena filopes]|nr:hypothetical protein C8R46DRAFT_1350258 [Mycena filopes]